MSACLFSKDELRRYQRQIILPEVGISGQERLKKSSVLIVGVGGLGSPLAMYLAALGVGRIGLVDFDAVDISNLHRQVIHGTADVGLQKLESAREAILQLNEDVKVDLYNSRLSSQNALGILRHYDIVVDGTDNFAAKYLINDACALLGKPNVYGSVYRFEGQVSVFWAGRGPCYRCLYPEVAARGMVPSCAEGGVLGVLPGVIGMLQACEVVKLILVQGEPLVGNLLLYDMLAAEFRKVAISKDPNCAICGDSPTIKVLSDIEQTSCMREGDMNDVRNLVEMISPEELRDELSGTEEICLIDVREPHEFDICHIAGAQLMPLSEIGKLCSELDSSANIVVYCKGGKRGAKAVEILFQSGFKKVRNLSGGILQWIEAVDPSLEKY